MAIDYTNLFTRLGHGFFVQESVNTSRGTTIPPLVKAYQDSFNSVSLPLKRAMAPAEAANRAYQTGAATMMSGMRSSMQQTLIEMVKADVAVEAANLTTALAELIRQMVADSQSVDASTGAASASAITGNGDGVLVVSAKRADGKNQENILAETIKISCTADSSPETASFVAKGDAAVGDRLSQDWPAGSGCSRTLIAIDAKEDDTLLLNGGFDTDDDETNVPDKWICSVGTAGTTIKLTSYEVQQIVVSGPPTAGTYRVKLTNVLGRVQWTEPLAYNATGAELQTAINALVGFEGVEVSTTGTTPNYTHVVTFTNVAGNIPRMGIDEQTTGGTYTVTTTTQGSSVTEVQTVAISGTPTGGNYTLTYTNASGIQQTTGNLAHNANSAAVQAALRLLNELEEVTVAESGSTPNFTHTITFTGVGGNVAQLTSTSALTGGTPAIAHATTTPGLAKTFVRRAMEFDSDGSQLTTIQQPVTLEPLKQYAVNLWMMADVVPAAGVVTIDLVDSIGGTVIADQAGTNNSFTVTCSALTTSYVAKNGVFRTPKILPTTVYLRIRITTAVSNGSSIFLDHCAMDEMTELYKGGPSAKIFSGKTPFFKGDAQVQPDYFVLTTTNDRAGEIQEWFDRNFLMREKGLLLPSNSAGGETINDSLVA